MENTIKKYFKIYAREFSGDELGLFFDNFQFTTEKAAEEFLIENTTEYHRKTKEFLIIKTLAFVQ